MTKRLILSAAVLALAAYLAWRAGDDDARPPPGAPPPPEAGDRAPGLPGDLLGEVELPRAARSPEAAAEGEAPVPGPVRVLVLGPGDRPLEGVRLHLVGQPSTRIDTGADGIAELPLESGSGPQKVALSGIVPWTVLRLEPDRLPERSTTLRFPDLLPLDVEVVDGETGLPVPGARPSIRQKEGAALAIPPAGRGFGLPVSPVERGERVTLVIQPGLPEGYVMARQGPVAVTGTVSRYAERVAATIVAWPEASVIVRVEEEDGRPAPDALVTAVISSLGLHYRAPPTGGRGQTSVRGLPRIPGETVQVHVEKDGRKAVSTRGRIAQAYEDLLLRAVLPPRAPVAAGSRNLIGIGGGAGGSFGGRGDRRRLGPRPTTALFVRVFRRDGSPARDTLVLVGGQGRRESGRRTGPDGNVLIEGLPPGPAKVFVREPGFLMGPPVEVELAEGSETRVEIREAEGTFLQLQVVTDEGWPAAFAELSVQVEGKVPYTHLVEGVQRLSIVADADGRAVLPHLPAGKVTVTARLGSRTASADAGPGGFLEIRLPRVN